MMTAAAPNIMLWHPARRAYLAASGNRFTRKIERAAVMTVAQSNQLHADGLRGLHPEPAFAPLNFTPRPACADLAEVENNELLRRAVRGLCARDRTQAPQWCVVMDALGLTSGAAVMLCRRLNMDPNKRTGH